ncbi:MAG: hypothetical protein WAX89_01030 [Alphaproteobacteria bacterium]
MKTTILALSLLVSVSHAADDTERMTKLLTNTTTAYAGQAATILAQQQKQVDAKCPLGKLEADNLSVLVTPEFNLDGVPEHGSWAVTYKAKACGKAVRRMMHFEGTKQGVNLEAGPPGATLADPVLAKDVWSSFMKAAIREKPDCNPREMLLRDTQMVEAPSTAAPFWREAWIGRVCGNEMGQIVTFYPSKAGTVFRMSLPGGPTPEREPAPTYTPQ